MRKRLENGYELINPNNNITYIIHDEKGSGANCIAYNAIRRPYGQSEVESNVIVKEYYPDVISIERDDDGYLNYKPEDTELFNRGLERLKKAESLQIQLRNECANNTLFILDSFFGNGTYYIVTEQYANGVTLDKTEPDRIYDKIKICRSVAEYVMKCHKYGYLCLDIKPENIQVIPETSEFPVFFDFDSFNRKEDIQKGHIITSYTEKWAAPEQLFPEKYNQITEATDVYILGELVFWSIFGRHSEDFEHKKWSTYDFNRSIDSKKIPYAARKSLTKLFRNTLRSYYKSRYASADSIITDLDIVLSEMNRSYTIVDVIPFKNDSFFGRENELEAISKQLLTENMAILKGIGGIGKSSLAIEYTLRNIDHYDKVIFCSYYIDLANTIARTDFLSNCEKYEEETIFEYSKRKINRLKELSLNSKLLFIIDNFNMRIEDIKDNSRIIWDMLEGLSSHGSKIIITTRCNQESYYRYQINIDRLANNDLNEMFLMYSDRNDIDYDLLQELVNKVAGNTLAIELLAKHVKKSCETPNDIISGLLIKGFSSLPNENIIWNKEERSVIGFLEALYDIDNLSSSQILTLLLAMYIPTQGLRKKEFINLFEKIDDEDLVNNIENDLNHLIDYSWVSYNNENRLIYIHPVLKEFLQNLVNKNPEILGDIYNIINICSTTAWIVDKKYDICSITKYCDEVCYKTVKTGFDNNVALLFLTNYCDNYSDYLSSEFKTQMLEYAVDKYDMIYKNTYSGERAFAHVIRSIHKCSIGDIEGLREECRSGLKEAKKHHDLYLTGLWRFGLFYTEYTINDYIWADFRKRMYPIFLRKTTTKIYREKRKKMKYMTDLYLDKLNYGSMVFIKESFVVRLLMREATCYEKQLDLLAICYMKPTKQIRDYIRHTVWLRNQVKEHDESTLFFNKVMKDIDYAIEYIMDHDYDSAVEVLEKKEKDFRVNNVENSVYLYKIYHLLGNISFIIGDFKDAVSKYRECLRVATSLNISIDISIKIFLARALLKLGLYEEGSIINKELIDEQSHIDKNAYLMRYYFGEIGVNHIIACLYSNDYESLKAFTEYSKKNFDSKSQDKVEMAMYKIGEIHAMIESFPIFKSNDDGRYDILNSIYVLMKDEFGEDHPETLRCKKSLDDILG